MTCETKMYPWGCRMSEEGSVSLKSQGEDPGCDGMRVGKDTREWEVIWAMDKLLGDSRVEAGLKHRNRSQLRYLLV